MSISDFTPFHLILSEEKQLRLNSLATAGYTWQFEIKDPSIISVERTTVQNSVEKLAIGASVDEVFTIKSLKKGTTLLIFTQSRIWEINTPPAKTINYQIIVD